MNGRVLLAILMCLTLSLPAVWPNISPASAAAATTAYTITDLGATGESDHAPYPAAINATGWVAGYYSTYSGHPFIWIPDVANDSTGTLRGLQSYFDGTVSHIFGINDAGQVAGTEESGSPVVPGYGFVWTPSTPDGASGTMEKFGGPEGPSGGSSVTGVNKAGQVIGGVGLPAEGIGNSLATLWQDGELVFLGSLGDAGTGTCQGCPTGADALNAQGYVVGRSTASVGGGPEHAYLWTPPSPGGTHGVMSDLGTLGGAGCVFCNSEAFAINDSRQVVGQSQLSYQGPFHAFLWSDATGMSDLKSLPGSDYSIARGINNRGQIIGTAQTSSSCSPCTWRATLWEDKSPIDLNTLIPADLGWTLDDATAINDAGQIVGVGTHQGTTTAFLLTPVSSTTSLQGNVYVDANGNGARDASESGYQGAMVAISGTTTRTTTTDSAGNYAFAGLQAGAYSVTLTVPPGYTATTTNPVSVPLAPGVASTLVNFGIVPMAQSPTPFLDIPFDWKSADIWAQALRDSDDLGSDNKQGWIESWFDHHYPTYLADKNQEMMRYDGIPHSSPTTNASLGCYARVCYDGHNGIDFAPKGEGDYTSIRPAASGIVEEVHTGCVAGAANVGCGGGYGNFVIVDHQNGYFTLYGHLGSVKVHKGIVVTHETELGSIGCTGNAYGDNRCQTHLHFGVYHDDGDRIWNNELNERKEYPDLPVDPFGWTPVDPATGMAVNKADPWVQDKKGPVSYRLWRDPGTVGTFSLALSSTPGGRAEAVPASPSEPAGTLTQLKATATAGYHFVNWTIDGVVYNKPAFYVLAVNADHRVVAYFAPGENNTPVPALSVLQPPDSRGSVAAYRIGNQPTLAATTAPGYLFVGWQVTGLTNIHAAAVTPVDSWANPLTFDLTQDITVTPVFAPRPSFPDVTPETTGAVEPIAQLAARGIIKGYEDGTFGPTDETLRAQMAALIVRAMGWGGEQAGTPFPDKCDSAGKNCVDDELWSDIGILAAHGVAKGYPDGTYGTLNPVLNAQVVSFITRAMVARGYWQFQPDDGTLYPNVPPASGHRQDLVTYVHYAGTVRGAETPTGDFGGWDQPSSRAWFAFVLWQALDSYFGR